MKANELMLDDWVAFPHGRERVQELSYIQGHGYCASFASSAALFSVEVEKLEPIPLTGEVLEKNGWYIPDLYLWYRHNSVPFLISEKGGNLFCLYADSEHDKREFFCTINYVHELQHALRLCGIDKEIIL